MFDWIRDIKRDHWGSFPELGLQNLNYFNASVRIPQSYSDVSFPAIVAYSAYWRALGILKELLFSPSKKIDKLYVIHPMPRRKILFSGGFGKFIPRAH